MRVVSSKNSRDGKTTRVTVDIQPGERLISVRDEAFYTLGEPMDEVVQGHILRNAQAVHWCPLGQRWERV